MNAPARPDRYIISGGGTGGHIYPALAIAQTLVGRRPDTEILFVGAEGRMEMEKVPAAGFRIVGLPVRGLQRRLTTQNLAFPFRVLRSLWQARALVRDFRPDVAIGVGGYASGPLLLAAALQGVPTLIQEQNSYAGITNKLLARWASRICVAYPDMDRYFPAEKLLLTGNPVRADLGQLTDKRAAALAHYGFAPERPVLMVMGGSLGARMLNESVAAMLPVLVEEGYQLLWQTGKTGLAAAQATAAAFPAAALRVHEFIYTMDLAYAAADVVVSRAGALSISELCLVGKPVVLVPSPNVAEDHQTKNAAQLVAHGAARLVRDADARTQLWPAVRELLADADARAQLSAQIRQLARPGAADAIADAVLALRP